MKCLSYKMKIKKRYTRNGFALTEVLLAVAVIIIVGVSAYGLYANARNSARVEAMANDMVSIKTSAKMIYSGQGSYNPPPAGSNNLTTLVLEKAGMAPPDLKTDVPGVWKNTYGQIFVGITRNTSPIAPFQSDWYLLSININANIDPASCSKLITRVAPFFDLIGGGGLLQFQPNGDKTVANNDGSIKGGTLSNLNTVDLNAVTRLCGNGSITFSSR